MTKQHRYEDPDDVLQIDTATTAPGGVVILHVRGDLDRDTAHRLTSAIGHALATAGADGVEVSLAGVTFIDAAGTRCLLHCRRAAETAGITMAVRDPSPPVARALHALGLLRRFDLAGTPADGIHAAGRMATPPVPDDGPDDQRAHSARLRRTA